MQNRKSTAFVIHISSYYTHSSHFKMYENLQPRNLRVIHSHQTHIGERYSRPSNR